MAKEEKPKEEGDIKIKGGLFQQSNSTRKEIFKEPTTGIEENVFFWGNINMQQSS